MANKGSFLGIGKYLGADDYLLSDNDLYMAYMQDDGNFILYHTTDSQPPEPDWNRPYWASNTARAEGQYYAVIQSDGNFVLCQGSDPTQNGPSYWSSDTALGDGQYYALLQDDGNFVLYRGSDPTQSGTAYWSALPQFIVEKKFMQNYRTSSAVNGGRDVVAVYNSQGQNELFTIGSDGNIHTFYPDTTSETGYNEATITTNLKVTALAAGLDSQKRVVVFAACGLDFYYLLESDDPTAPWSTPQKVDVLPVVSGATSITSIVAQEIAGGLYVAVTEVMNADQYFVAYADWQADAVQFLKAPYNPYPNDPHCFFEGNTPQNVTLALFMPEKLLLCPCSGQQGTTASLTPALNPISVGAVLDATGTTQTFAILEDHQTYHLLKGPDQNGIAQYSWTPLWQDDPAYQAIEVPFQEVVVEADSTGSAHVFSISQPVQIVEGDSTAYNVLYHWIPEATSATGYISPPTPIHKSVGMNSGAVGNSDGTIELFAVEASGIVTHLFQAEESTDWTAQIVEIGTGPIEEYASYSTDVTIYDNLGALLVDTPVNISVSEPTRLTVNGATFFADEHRPVQVLPNSAGMLSISQETDSLASPSFQFNVPGLMLPEASIVVEPYADVENQLATTTSDDLMNATVEDGSYLLSDEYRNPTDTTNLASAINECMGMVGTPTLMTTPAAFMRRGTRRGVWHRSSGSASDMRRIASENVNQHWQISFAGNKVRYRTLTPQEAATLRAEKRATLPAVTGFFDFISDIGDFAKGVANGILDVFDAVVETISGVVNATITFILDGVTYIFETVIEFVEQAFDMVELIFAKVKVFFEMLYQWLAWLFQWKDILRCHDALAYTINQFLGFLQGSASGIQSLVDSSFSTLASQINSWFDQAVSMMGQSTVGGYVQSSGQSSPQFDSSISNNFVYNEFINNINGSSELTLFQDFLQANGDAVDAFLQQLTTFATTIEVSPAFSDALQYFTNLGGSPDQIFKQLMSGLIRVAQGIVQVGLSSLQGLVDALLQLMSTAVASLQQMLNEKWNIPFVTQFYSWITGGSALTTLDLIALIAAIPTTILYKSVFKASPFPNQDSLNAFTGAFNTQLMLQAAGFAPSAAAMLSDDPPVITLTKEQANVMASFYLICMVVGGFLTCLSDQMAPKSSFLLTVATVTLSGGAFACSYPWFTSQGTLNCETKVGKDMWTWVVSSFIVSLLAVYVYARGRATLPSNDTMAVVLSAYGMVSFGMSIYSTMDEDSLVQAGRIIPTIPPMCKLLRYSSLVAATDGGSNYVLSIIDILCYYTGGGVGFALFYNS